MTAGATGRAEVSAPPRYRWVTLVYVMGQRQRRPFATQIRIDTLAGGSGQVISSLNTPRQKGNGMEIALPFMSWQGSDGLYEPAKACKAPR